MMVHQKLVSFFLVLLFFVISIHKGYKFWVVGWRITDDQSLEELDEVAIQTIINVESEPMTYHRYWKEPAIKVCYSSNGLEPQGWRWLVYLDEEDTDIIIVPFGYTFLCQSAVRRIATECEVSIS